MKKFADREKEYVRDILIENGKKAFSRAGIKKTSIEELTKSTGISKGSFYSFFDSKEELYLHILISEIQKAYQSGGIDMDHNATPALAIYSFLKTAVYGMSSNPILKLMLIPEEYETVKRRLTVAGIEPYAADIATPLKNAIMGWQEKGIVASNDPNLLAGVIKCLFLLTTHQEEIGNVIYDDVMDFLLETVAEKIALQS